MYSLFGLSKGYCINQQFQTQCNRILKTNDHGWLVKSNICYNKIIIIQDNIYKEIY